MRITYCLPLILKNPAGGYKIVFEYANRLVERGYDVTIVFLTDENYTNTTKSNIIKKMLGTIELFNYPKWFKLDKRIKKNCDPLSRWERFSRSGSGFCYIFKDIIYYTKSFVPKRKKVLFYPRL